MPATRTEVRRSGADGPPGSYVIAPEQGDADAVLATSRIARECRTAAAARR
jgi:hypothetical protein